MKIIGLTGAAGSGKDTACGFALEWCEDRGLTAERLAFADPLKISAAACFGVPPSDALAFCNWLKQPGVFVEAMRLEGSAGDLPSAEGSNIKGKRVSGRQFLQFYGTEAHRDVFDREFWVNVTEEKLNVRAGNLDVVFLTDPRFPNESAMIHKHDGEVWKIERPNAAAIEAHSSEAGLPEDDLDLRVNNVGSLEDLQAEVHLVCEARLGGLVA